MYRSQVLEENVGELQPFWLAALLESFHHSQQTNFKKVHSILLLYWSFFKLKIGKLFTLTKDDLVGSSLPLVSTTSSSCGEWSPIKFNTAHLINLEKFQIILILNQYCLIFFTWNWISVRLANSHNHFFVCQDLNDFK